MWDEPERACHICACIHDLKMLYYYSRMIIESLTHTHTHTHRNFIVTSDKQIGVRIGATVVVAGLQ